MMNLKYYQFIKKIKKFRTVLLIKYLKKKKK